MESKQELLLKLGFSKEYLDLINEAGDESIQNGEWFFYGVPQPEILDINLTTLIIEKTDKPINKEYIFNRD